MRAKRPVAARGLLPSAGGGRRGRRGQQPDAGSGQCGLKQVVLEGLDIADFRKTVKTKIFLGYTSNLISSDLRETLRFLAQHKMVDVIVSSAGSFEEVFINNLLVPNDNYCKFEDWMDPILDKILEEQKTQRTERNALLTELQQCRVKNLTMPNPSRRTKVKKSMARIKLVLHERSDIYKSNQAKKAAEQ
ncbi:hypothetical protein PInf_018264 [Phytophthora infestans]|nr:hypothetical protein PInf_018264 [Phytophthora infestans]